jgi:hypothetical protein
MAGFKFVELHGRGWNSLLLSPTCSKFPPKDQVGFLTTVCWPLRTIHANSLLCQSEFRTNTLFHQEIGHAPCPMLGKYVSLFGTPCPHECTKSDCLSYHFEGDPRPCLAPLVGGVRDRESSQLCINPRAYAPYMWGPGTLTAVMGHLGGDYGQAGGAIT